MCHKVIGVSESLNENDFRSDLVEIAAQMPGTSGREMPDAENGNLPAHGVTSPVLQSAVMLSTGGEQRSPFGPSFFHHVGQVFLPDDAVFLFVFHDRALQTRSDIV